MSTPDGYRRSALFEWPAAVPWSELGPEFIAEWGRPDGRFEPEHVEVTGKTRSGKTYFVVDILQQRARLRGSAEIFVATKKADKTFALLGWPVIDDVRDLDKYRQAIFWPRAPQLTGDQREAYHEQKIYELLSSLYREDANVVIAYDEKQYLQNLSKRLNKILQQILREGASHGITDVSLDQRPIGMTRHQHSETTWKVVFPPADQADADRFAQLLGRPRDWVPVFETLDQMRHEFVIKNVVTGAAYISWIDYPVEPIAAQAHQEERTPREYLHGRRRAPA